MLDKDRGTYSPPTEDNLSYETRRQPSRDNVPMTLIISGICLIVLLLAVVIFVNLGLNRHGGAPQEVGDVTSGDFKDGKVTEAKPLSDKDLTLDTGGNATFAPGTEAPVQRAAPASQDAAVTPAPTASVAPAPVAPIAGPLPSQSGDVPLAAKPVTAPVSKAPVLKPPLSATSAPLATSKPTAANPVATSPVATNSVATSNVPVPGTPVAAVKTPAVSKPVAAVKPATGAPVSAGGVSVQIGAFASPEIANKQYATVTSSYGLFLNSSTGKRVEKVETEKGTFYRTSVTGFASAEKAKAFCSALKAAGRDCFVK